MAPQATSSMFHIDNRETTHKLNIVVDKARLQSQSVPTYLGVKLDRTLTFKQYLESIKAKTTSRVALIRRLAGTTSLVFLAAEYCAPVWSHSHHVKKLDVTLNSALRTLSGTLQATPVNQLLILAGIVQASIRREADTLALSRKAQKSESHLLHKTVPERPQCAHLKS